MKYKLVPKFLFILGFVEEERPEFHTSEPLSHNIIFTLQRIHGTRICIMGLFNL